jgi:hypothetical protein
LTEVIVNAGSCGFTATVVVAKEAQGFRISISSDCEMVSNWSDHLQPLPLREILNPQNALRFYESALRHIQHVACPVPLSVIRAIEVEAGAAPARDVSIHFFNQGQKNFKGEAGDDFRREKKGNT